MFALSHRSLSRLDGVRTPLAEIVHEAIRETPVDFAVVEGMRTRETQAEYVAKGVSRTMKSRHLTGHAVDLVPIVAGRACWEIQTFFPVADTVCRIAVAHGVPLRWGGAWRWLLKNGDTTAEVKSFNAVQVHSLTAEYAHLSYVDLCVRDGRVPFVDGPHFEMETEEDVDGEG